jgi:hypothetical protein
MKQVLIIGLIIIIGCSQTVKRSDNNGTHNKVQAVNEATLPQSIKGPVREIIIRGFESLQSKGYHFTTKITGHSNYVISDTNIAYLTINGVSNDKSNYIRIKKTEDTITDQEICILKGRGAYYNDVVPNIWNEIDWECYELDIFIPHLPFLDDIEKARIIGVEKIEGIECVAIGLSLSESGGYDILRPCKTFMCPQAWSQEESAKVITSYKIWVGKNDNYIYKIECLIDAILYEFWYATEPSNTRTVIIQVICKTNVFDYDKNIDIKIPDEVQKLADKYYPVDSLGH